MPKITRTSAGAGRVLDVGPPGIGRASQVRRVSTSVIMRRPMASVPAFDPRLLRRARAVRRLLVADAAVGVAMALLVLAQAVLLARVAARAFDGASLADVARPLGLLVAVVVARSAGAWAFEVAGRRAAADVSRSCGSTSSRPGSGAVRRRSTAPRARRSRPRPSPASTRSRRPFARYLPQLVLALVVPVAVLALVASIDILAGRDGAHAAARPALHVARRALHRAPGPGALARDEPARESLPRRRPGPADPAGVQPRAGAGGAHRRVSDEYRRASMGTLRAAFLSGAVLELAATLGIALVAVVVGVGLAEGDIGFEPALTVLVLAPELYLPLRNLAAQFHASADGAAVAARMLDLSEAPPCPPAERSPPSLATATIAFEGVAFRYPERDRDALQDVDLELRPGETVALVGPSGGGKTTLVSLLLRFAEPSSGRIVVGGVDLAALDAAAWRRALALVPQRPTLFRGTIADNIRLGDPAADDLRVRARGRARRSARPRLRSPRRVRDGRRRRRPPALGG